jgi:hypothetical protein
MDEITQEIPSETNPTGRRSFDPTPEKRDMVRAMASYGIPQEHIARHLHIAPKTLRKHFRSELRHAAYDANNEVLASLFKMATTRHNVAAAIFWSKARCGFRPGAEPYDKAPGATALPPKKGIRTPPDEEPPYKQSALNNLIVYNNDGEPNADY